MSFLDETGLSRFLLKLKAWIAGGDSNLVHRTGAEDIDGAKTFLSTPAVKSIDAASDKKATNLVQGTVSGTAQGAWLYRHYDSQGALAAFTRGVVGADGGFSWQIGVNGWVAGNTTTDAFFAVGVTGGTLSGDSQLTVGVPYATCPQTPLPADRNVATDIVTRGFIPRDTRIVHTTGDENIGGVKTFTATGIQGAGSFNVASAVDTAQTALVGGPSESDGAAVWAFGKSRTANPGSVRLRPYLDASTYKDLFAKPDGTLTWNGQAIQTSSDERLKTAPAPVPDAVLDAWGSVNWGQFQFLDAVERKGVNARLHLGLIAQHVRAVFEAQGLDACAYGILCYDGDEDLWMVRYEEALAMETAFQRRRADRLEARLAAVEERLDG